MNETTFVLNEQNLRRFLRRHITDADTRVLEPDWNPTTYGTESDIHDLIQHVQDTGMPDAPIVTVPDDMEINLNCVEHEDGGAYQWQVYVPRQGFYLGSMFEEMRKIVQDDITGLAAAVAIVREGVASANELLRNLADLRHERTDVRGCSRGQADLVTPGHDGDPDRPGHCIS